MEVDALLIMALAVLVVQFQKAGVWVLASGLMRYLFVAAAWVLPWMSRSLPLARRRQAVCVIQMSGLMLALAPFVPAPVSVWVAAVSLVVLAWSFWVDVRWLWHHAPDER
jgi:phosphatidylglycerophosphate synthase